MEKNGAHISKNLQMVFSYSVTHFLVDFACAFLMFRYISITSSGYICVLIYNFCAFALQMPLGILVDIFKRNSLFAVSGCVFLGVAFGLVKVPIICVIIAGIGNALFHIGGGADILSISDKSLKALGVFVSPGAFGIYFGTILGKRSSSLIVFILPALFMAAGLIYVFWKKNRGTDLKEKDSELSNNFHRQFYIAALFFIFVVCLRSYLGLSVNFPWKSDYGLILICAVVFGKVAGGIIADRFGLTMTSLSSLGIATVMFLFPNIPITGITGIFLFNMTMPITLYATAKILKETKGFAFGLLSFGLFLGFLPIYFGVNTLMNTPVLHAIIALFSLFFLLAGLLRAKL